MSDHPVLDAPDPSAHSHLLDSLPVGTRIRRLSAVLVLVEYPGVPPKEHPLADGDLIGMLPADSRILLDGREGDRTVELTVPGDVPTLFTGQTIPDVAVQAIRRFRGES